MPFLDVSDLTVDPDFADTFTVTRRREAFDHGRLIPGATTVYAGVIGVIDMAGPNELKRFPEGQITGKVISIVTKFRLMASGKIGTDTYQPDTVTWHGSDYVIIWIDDYDEFGAGQIEALAESRTTQDPPPQGTPP